MTTSRRRLHTAGDFFATGNIERCEAICRALKEEGYDSPELASMLGEILLLQNRLGDAPTFLEQAAREQAGNPRMLSLLAECRRRRGELAEAAALYRQLGRSGLAAKLDHVADGGWYLVPQHIEISLPWIAGAQLPLVKVRVNGIEGSFLIDTGVGETLIDPVLARAAGLASLGVEAIHFPSGPAGRVEHTVVDSLGLGELSMGRVPAQVHPTREVFGELLPSSVDGILGTSVLARAPATLDYRQRTLRMGERERPAAGVNFYFAGDQYPLVRARINGRVDTLLFVDTGMIGAAIGLPFSTAEEAEVEVARDLAGTGYGIASELKAKPFLCRSLEAAGAERRSLPGMLIGHFRLEHQFGFRVGGLVGDGFFNSGVLRIDFSTMRMAFEA